MGKAEPSRTRVDRRRRIKLLAQCAQAEKTETLMLADQTIATLVAALSRGSPQSALATHTFAKAP